VLATDHCFAQVLERERDAIEAITAGSRAIRAIRTSC
jgi:hypothetical protein